MIRYPVTAEVLEARVKQLSPTWLTKALAKKKEFEDAEDYLDHKAFWSDIKEVFLDLQHEKCAYCERRLGGKSLNKKEYDIEHYRPKNAVKAWPSAADAEKLAYQFATGDAADKGYYLLAYNLRNYSATCTGCNSSLKSSYFPVAGNRVLDSDNYDSLGGEKPYLLCPVGNDDDPEDLITFKGTVAVPRVSRGLKYRRARVTIDFFELNIREDLNRERAAAIMAVWMAYNKLGDANASEFEKKVARTSINFHTWDGSPHTNCSRAFYQLCQDSPQQAAQCVEEIIPIIEEMIRRNEPTP